MNRSALLVSAVAGGLWATVAGFLVRDPEFWGPIADARWSAAAIGPLIGVAVYLVSAWAYRRAWWIRAPWAVATLYLAATVYGVALGAIGHKPGTGGAEILLPVFVIWWALTCVPVCWILFAGAIANHELIRTLGGRTGERKSHGRLL